MNRTLLLSCLILFLGMLPSMAIDKENYGTEVATQLVERANALYNKGKLADAKVLYSEALATGDSMFTKICTEKIRVINTLLAKEKTASSAFTISDDVVSFNYLGGEYPIHVTGEKWTATTQGNEDWCKIEVDRKKGYVKITSAPNDGTQERSTVITIRNGNGQKKVVEVFNQGSPEILRSSAQNLVFTPSGETNIVDIEANTEWKVANVPDWLKAIKGHGDIQFTAQANNENKDRIAHVKVESPNSQQIIINIIQNAALDSLAFSKNDLHFGPDGGDEYIHVYTDAKDWRFGDFPHWCQLERLNDNTIRIHCTPNEPVDMPREASINVTNGSQTLGINVFQAPKPIVHLIPVDGIGGRRISFGFSAGYVYPMISAKSSSPHTYSPINYNQTNDLGAADYSSSGGFSVSAFTDIRIYKNLYLNVGLDFIYYKFKNSTQGTFKQFKMTGNNDVYYYKGDMMASFEENFTSMFLDVPIAISYRLPISKTSHFKFNVGPLLSIGLSQKMAFSGNLDSDLMYQYSIVNGTQTNELYDPRPRSIHDIYNGNFDMFSSTGTIEKESSLHLSNSVLTSEILDGNAAPYNRINFGLHFGIGYEWMGIGINVSYQWLLTNMGNRNFWDGRRFNIFKQSEQLMRGYSQHNNYLKIDLSYTFRY